MSNLNKLSILTSLSACDFEYVYSSIHVLALSIKLNLFIISSTLKALKNKTF